VTSKVQHLLVFISNLDVLSPAEGYRAEKCIFLRVRALCHIMSHVCRNAFSHSAVSAPFCCRISSLRSFDLHNLDVTLWIDCHVWGIFLLSQIILTSMWPAAHWGKKEITRSENVARTSRFAPNVCDILIKLQRNENAKRMITFLPCFHHVLIKFWRTFSFVVILRVHLTAAGAHTYLHSEWLDQ
jgi:hypothetical protein